MRTDRESHRIKSVLAPLLLVALFLLVSQSSTRAQSVASLTPLAPEGSRAAPRLFGRMNWSVAQHAYTAPREICRLVQKNIRYATDKRDQWAPAQTTWERGRGDCEDFALLIQELCRQQGITTKVHLYFPAGGKREGHAVLVGEWNGKTWFSSNGSYEEVRSEEEVRRRVARFLSVRESQLWVMKLTDTDVARFLGAAPAGGVTTASL